jgi:hypothetical protein
MKQLGTGTVLLERTRQDWIDIDGQFRDKAGLARSQRQSAATTINVDRRRHSLTVPLHKPGESIARFAGAVYEFQCEEG